MIIFAHKIVIYKKNNNEIHNRVKSIGVIEPI